MPRRQLTLPRLPSRPAPRRPQASAPVTGVRIGATHVGLACAAASRGPLTARASASAVLPPGAVRDGEVIDAIAVAQALRQAVDGRSFGKQVRIGVGCQKVAVRVLDLPPVQNEDDLDAAVRMIARERIPTAAENALIDYRILPERPTPDGQPDNVRRALVVAARRELVDGQVAAVKAAGLEPVGVDLLAFGLARMVQPSEPTMLLDLDGVTTLALADPDGCRFVRTIPAGVQSAAEELARRLDLDVDDASAGLLGDRSLSPEQSAEATAVLARTVRAIATTVRTSVEFHVDQEDGESPQLCVVSGPLAGLEGVSVLLSEALDLPVHPAAALAGGADPVALGLSVEES